MVRHRSEGVQRTSQCLSTRRGRSEGPTQPRCAAAGLDGRFSAHSLRSGFVTEAGLRDMPVGEAMAMTGHRTVATFQGYYQSAAIRRSKVASMLDTPPPKDA